MENEKKEPNVLEKTIFVVGLLIIVLLLSYLSYDWATRSDAPPDLKISTRMESNSSGNTYKVETKNVGMETAKAVHIEFNLYRDGSVKETAVLDIDYVPVQSKETGWVSFRQSKTMTDSIVVGSVSYLKP
ncbi:hypothetical protein [Salinimicrobium sp. HB62]|uniref:hypothetical protein n=1 Tax=Salinimicrobium sp. HB62 TaxID=3077781 RepID=UPI002D76E789|nr:hypothetical protein [Salinimicrobium sp. HB62]